MPELSPWDSPNHITQRRNGRRPVFFSDRDCEVYFRRLAGYGACETCSIVSFLQVSVPHTGPVRSPPGLACG